MSLFRRPKRKVPVPEVVGPKKAVNPLFGHVNSQRWRSYRQAVLLTTAGLVVLILVGLAVYGPWGRITAVQVTGTRDIDPASVKTATERYLDHYRWLILPNDKILLLSANDLSEYLRQLISDRIAVEQVRVVKQRPHQITIHITERDPVLTWDNGRTLATVDRHGVIIEATSSVLPDQPLVKDQLQTEYQIGQEVLTTEVVTAITSIQTQLQAVQLAAEYYIIPEATCPVTIDQNANGNTNNALNNDNTNQVVVLNAAVNDNVNLNVNAVTCDLVSIRKATSEIHLKLKDGPKVLIDRRQDIYKSIAVLKLVLLNPDHRIAEYIDVRFIERVYIK